MVAEFKRMGQSHGKMGIKLRNRDTGQELQVEVKDKYPQMEDVHVEGRRVVEVSVELFINMSAAIGFDVVDPNEVAPGGTFLFEEDDEDTDGYRA